MLTSSTQVWNRSFHRLQNSRFRLFRKARSAISVILECRASLSVILECRASLTRPQGVWGEKTTVGFSYNEFVLSRCRIMSREVTEIAWQLHPHLNLILWMQQNTSHNGTSPPKLQLLLKLIMAIPRKGQNTKAARLEICSSTSHARNGKQY
mgnify:CR=1 FL=1